MITLFLRLLFRLVTNLKHKLFNFLLHNLSLKPLNKIQNIIDNKYCYKSLTVASHYNA